MGVVFFSGDAGMKVYIKKVDEGFGLFWEDGVPIYDGDSGMGGLTPIKMWRRRGWAIRYANARGMELLESMPE